MRRLVVVLLLAGIMLSCLGVFLSLATTRSDVPSAFAGADVAHVDRGANVPLPDGGYRLTLAEEVQETHKLPVNAELLTMLLLACSFGASVGWLLTNARRRRAIRSSGADRPPLVAAPEVPSILEVFRL
jgi:hypothetical protein